MQTRRKEDHANVIAPAQFPQQGNSFRLIPLALATLNMVWFSQSSSPLISLVWLNYMIRGRRWPLRVQLGNRLWTFFETYCGGCSTKIKKSSEAANNELSQSMSVGISTAENWYVQLKSGMTGVSGRLLPVLRWTSMTTAQSGAELSSVTSWYLPALLGFFIDVIMVNFWE